MPSFLDSVEACYGTKDLYQALGVRKNAKESELRRAYLKLSLKVHPDRVEADHVEEATIKFQVPIKNLYCVLSICISMPENY